MKLGIDKLNSIIEALDVDEKIIKVVRNGKVTRVRVRKKTKRHIPTSAQRKGYRDAARKRKRKKASSNRKRAKSNKVRKRSNIKTGKPKGYREVS